MISVRTSCFNNNTKLKSIPIFGENYHINVKSFTIIPVTGIDSTNNHLKELNKTGKFPEGTVILADYQTKGRGRGDNTWYSGKDLNILMSVLLRPGIHAEKFFFLTEIASLALTDLLSEIGISAKVKWPNDIYSGAKKIAGLLIENAITSGIIESTVIGIGLNVNENVFPENLPNPVSIGIITGKDHNIDHLLELLLNKLMARYTSLLSGAYPDIHKEYNSCLFRRNEPNRFSFKDQQFEASIESVREDGLLVLKTESGKFRKFTFGDLEMII